MRTLHRREPINPVSNGEDSSKALEVAPSYDEVLRYWQSGRTEKEAKGMMLIYQTKCALCPTMIYYLPEAGKGSPSHLICDKHGEEEKGTEG